MFRKRKKKERYYKVVIYKYDYTDVYYCSDVFEKFSSLCLYHVKDRYGKPKYDKDSSVFIKLNSIEQFDIETLYK